MKEEVNTLVQEAAVSRAERERERGAEVQERPT